MSLPRLSFWEKRLQSRGRKSIQQWLESRRKNVSRGLNIGCGLRPIPGLINVDKYSDVADQQIEVRDLLAAFPDKVEHIEAHHVIEHLSFDESANFGSLCYELLDNKLGGSVVITCPDLKSVAWRYMISEVVPWKRHDQAYCLKMLYGSQENEGMYHRSGFTKKVLIDMLRHAGFSNFFSYRFYPSRPTPSLCVIGWKNGAA